MDMCSVSNECLVFVSSQFLCMYCSITSFNFFCNFPYYFPNPSCVVFDADSISTLEGIPVPMPSWLRILLLSVSMMWQTFSNWFEMSPRTFLPKKQVKGEDFMPVLMQEFNLKEASSIFAPGTIFMTCFRVSTLFWQPEYLYGNGMHTWHGWYHTSP